MTPARGTNGAEPQRVIIAGVALAPIGCYGFVLEHDELAVFKPEVTRAEPTHLH